MTQSRSSRPRLAWLVPGVLGVLCALVAAGLLVRPEVVTGLFGRDPLVVGGSRTPLPTASTPPPVLTSVPVVAEPVSAAAITARVNSVKVEGVTDVSWTVLDANSAAYASSMPRGRPMVPASSMKVLSGLVALDVLGNDRRFTTRVVAGSAGKVILVGGGDPLLTSAPNPGGASLTALADETAAALKAAGRSQVALGYDATLFTGPVWLPMWPPYFSSSVAPVSALTVDHARPDLNRLDRATDPARHAGDTFAALLKARGITVSSVAPAKAATSAAVVSAARSAPVSSIVEHTLLVSDNDSAEVLMWHVAIARGKPGSFLGAAAVFPAELKRRGLLSPGMVLQDANGISVGNLVSPNSLASAIKLGLNDPLLRPLVTGLPVAGVSGTLERRFVDPTATDARGIVRAKTGSIRGVNSLTGFTRTADGHVLVFSLMVNNSPANGGARVWIDRVAAALAQCGCQR